MRRCLARATLGGFATVLCLCSALEARVNLLEPWHPGQDCELAVPRTLETQVSFLRGTNFLEVPLSLTYAISEPLELGARWGVKYRNDVTGINDLLVGIKYVVLNSFEYDTNICAEAGLQLPTADYSNAIGTGAVAFIVHGSLEKDLKVETGYDLSAFFGLGYTFNGQNSNQLRYGDVFWYHAGVAYDFNDFLRFYTELKGFNHAHDRLFGNEVGGSDYQELYLSPAVDSTLFNGTILTSALLLGLTPQSNDWGVLISTKF